MNLGNITGTALSNADKIGYIAGALASDGIGTILSSIQQAAAGVIHPPTTTDLQTIFNYSEVRTAIMAYAAGVGVNALAPSNFKKFGAALEKGAAAYGIAFFLQKLLYAMTHSEIKGVNVENGQSSFLNQAQPVSNYSAYNY